MSRGTTNSQRYRIEAHLCKNPLTIVVVVAAAATQKSHESKTQQQ